MNLTTKSMIEKQIEQRAEHLIGKDENLATIYKLRELQKTRHIKDDMIINVIETMKDNNEIEMKHIFEETYMTLDKNGNPIYIHHADGYEECKEE